MSQGQNLVLGIVPTRPRPLPARSSHVAYLSPSCKILSPPPSFLAHQLLHFSVLSVASQEASKNIASSLEISPVSLSFSHLWGHQDIHTFVVSVSLLTF